MRKINNQENEINRPIEDKDIANNNSPLSNLEIITNNLKVKESDKKENWHLYCLLGISLFCITIFTQAPIELNLLALFITFYAGYFYLKDRFKNIRLQFFSANYDSVKLSLIQSTNKK
jgi:hypothetical protein